MKIVIKEIKQDASTLLVYVMDQNNNPFECHMIDHSEEQTTVNKLSEKYNTTTKERFDYNQYINQV
jgi:hypothetical protein